MKKVQITVRKQYKAPAIEVVEVDTNGFMDKGGASITGGNVDGEGYNGEIGGAKSGVWTDFNDDLGPNLGPSNSEEDY